MFIKLYGIRVPMATVTINKEECIGCGSCESIAGDIFEMKDDGKAHVKKKNLTGDDIKKAKEAEDICPVDAINVKE